MIANTYKGLGPFFTPIKKRNYLQKTLEKTQETYNIQKTNTQKERKMASYIKPSRVFTGRDSYGRYVERALGENGVWYARHNEQTQWGNQTTKWYVTEEPRFETECENAYSGEIIKHEPVCTWGWNRMGEIEDLPRLRLPVVEITENKE